MKALSIKGVSKLMNETYTWEDFAKFLFDYGTLLLDSNNDFTIEREYYYEYKGNYFYFTRERGEIVKVGHDTNIPVVVEHWNKQGITYLVKTNKMPLGKGGNSNVRYIIKENN